jgi:hypothetical protein
MADRLRGPKGRGHRGNSQKFILMTYSLMNCNVAIHCTLVVRNIVMACSAEPWFMHAVAKRCLTQTSPSL